MTTALNNMVMENHKTLHSVNEAFVLLKQGDVLYLDCSEGFLAVYKKRSEVYGLIIGQRDSLSFDFGPTLSEKRVMSMIHSSILKSTNQYISTIPRNSFFSTLLQL